MSRNNRICTLNLSAKPAPVCPARRRLTESFIRLQDIEFARMEWDDPLYAKALEDRIVWRELLDLELQDIDERIEEIFATSGQE